MDIGIIIAAASVGLALVGVAIPVVGLVHGYITGKW